MTYEAVVFDLFGTLTRDWTVAARDAMVARMAVVLGAPVEMFGPVWEDTHLDRLTGVATVEENIRATCAAIGVAPSDEGVVAAVALRVPETEDYLLEPRAGALDTLGLLKGAGYRTALVSACTPEVPEIWPRSPLARHFDVTVFSCEVGVNKPDPKIYLLATDGLGVEPGACLFVGDGAFGELNGAAAVGMDAVHFRDPSETAGEIHRPQADEWDGPWISTLGEVTGLLSPSC